MMEDFRLGACPRCEGDLALSQDHWGAYWHCLQCGWHEGGAARQRRDLPLWLTGVVADLAGRRDTEAHVLATPGVET